MQLSVLERLLILNLGTLPHTGNIITLKVKKDLIDSVSFSEDEINAYGLKSDGGKVEWDDTVDPMKEVDIREQGIKLLIEAIEKADNLNEKYIPLYDRLKGVSDGITK
jgi:hypothetical protein